MLALRRRERVVLGRPARAVLGLLEEREVDDEEELPGPGRNQLEAPREVRPQRAEHALDDWLGVGGDERDRAGHGSRGLAQRGDLRLGEELRDRRAHAAVGLEDQVREPLAAPLLGELGELVEVLARERARAARDAQAAHDAAGCDGAGEDAELRARNRVADIADLEPVAQVGLVRAVAREPPRGRACAGTAARPRGPRRARPRPSAARSARARPPARRSSSRGRAA